MPTPDASRATRSAPPRGRLAPSPTGRLHLGHARSFLAAWWSARAAGGELVLRIEDLDRDRCRAEFEADLLRDLEWLGLDWDGAVLRQSDDLEPYATAVQQLLDGDRAYACTCSRTEIQAAQSAPHGTAGELPYPGTCAGRWTSREEAEARTGGPAGVRFRLPDAPVELVDRVAGAVSANPAIECGDFLLLRRDAVVAYQLAVVVDDARQGITEVVRGDDLLSSTFRQARLQAALDLPRPEWAHLPLVLDADGQRLAKRDRATELTELRAAGLSAVRVVAWAAESLGILLEPLLQELDPGAPTATWTARLAREFRWERVPLGPVRTPSGGGFAAPPG